MHNSVEHAMSDKQKDQTVRCLDLGYEGFPFEQDVVTLL